MKKILDFITEEMKQLAKKEGISAKAMKDLIAQGRVVILKNKSKNHNYNC
mgnify:CR=1 FL=1